MLLELRYLLADLRLTLARRRFGRALDQLVRKYRPDQPRMPRGVPEGGEWTVDPNSARQQALAASEHLRVAVGPKCDGFSGGCQMGGTFGTTGHVQIGGKRLCMSCAVKFLGLEGLPYGEQIETIDLIDPNLRGKGTDVVKSAVTQRHRGLGPDFRAQGRRSA